MKKVFLAAVVGILSMNINSCKEDFNPIGEVRDGYVLTLIIRGDTTYQAATLYKNYSVDGFDPYQHDTDPSVQGADVRVWQGDSVSVFNEISIERAENSRYTGVKTIYQNNNFVMNSQSSTLEVEVVLPFGKRLKAVTVTPQPAVFDNNTSAGGFPTMDSGGIVPIYWSSENGEIIYQPRLVIRYAKDSEAASKIYEIDVPQNLATVNGETIKEFPKPSRNVSFFASEKIIDIIMEEIGNLEGNSRNDILIDAAYFKLLTFDITLSSYYISTNSELDGFSIKVDGTDFTNIDGGFGIFGSYRYQELKLKIFRDYIESFGYKALNPD